MGQSTCGGLFERPKFDKPPIPTQPPYANRGLTSHCWFLAVQKSDFMQITLVWCQQQLDDTCSSLSIGGLGRPAKLSTALYRHEECI